MSIRVQQIPLEAILGSPEVLTWRSQFGKYSGLAAEILSKLKYVSRDAFAGWLTDYLRTETASPASLFAVRKPTSDVEPYWDSEGKPRLRTSASLGSEDLVNSVIAALKKEDPNHYLDHPDLNTMAARRSKDLYLLDDSIGSGGRVKDFLSPMLKHPRFRSWWNFGYVRIHVVALATNFEAHQKIRESIPGFLNYRAKYPIHEKLRFHSHVLYRTEDWARRWGANAHDIRDFCDSVRAVPDYYRRGWGGIMANLVFSHSVPDNIPGLLWYRGDDTNGNYRGPLSNRTLPEWFSKLLDDSDSAPAGTPEKPDPLVLQILLAAKKGVHTVNGIGWSVGHDPAAIWKLIDSIQSAGLLSVENRLTEAGMTFIKRTQPARPPITYDHSLYIPKSWCADQETV
ncbi:MAG: hypothetical protein C0483_09020 [Pirellula sp.]|nr:hypothetical protein [Pirellula sp.]